MSLEEYTDEQIVDGILHNDERIIGYFFNRKCRPIFAYIIRSVFDFQIDETTLVSELYLYLQENDWYKVRQFKFRSKLTTWASVVATRFFQEKRSKLIESGSTEALNRQIDSGLAPFSSIDHRIDIEEAMKKMPNERYRQVIEKLDIQGYLPEELAEEMNVTIDNLYNIHRRARLQLRMVMGRKEDYV